MKTQSIITAAVLSAFLAFPTDAIAGPAPGDFRCEITRTSRAAKLKIRQWICLVLASNPSIPLAAFSTLVTCSTNNGTSESLKYTLEVQDNGDVKVMVKGKLKLADGTHRFEASGVGPGTFTSTSFATKIEKANLSGPGDATITVSAGSPAPDKIDVEIFIKPTSMSHPLRRGYKARCIGKLKP